MVQLEIFKTIIDDRKGMPFNSSDSSSSMRIWFPLLPKKDVIRLNGDEDTLDRINSAYDDWRASMRAKPFIGTKIGVIFDRIRMLTINIGVASGTNRRVAESVQYMLSKRLRESAIDIINNISRDIIAKDIVKAVLVEYFQKVKFTRDNDPEFDIEELVKKKMKRDDVEEVVSATIQEGTNVIKRLYIRLLSASPWDNE